ncbi:[FeFe] hydrogenase, group A [Fusobacterium sp. FSA-380-WT-3A]|uniref:[FeFe] hydrogenase, group A n=1 Tax=Fusobacterium sp. FSA-380-WT-3A TaxID=2725304 RepID=UPI001476F044|nr:[FeFe] hydrogenase, group A [Fusobacterium sp. FSA-380-WT-3A]NME35063.1 4Fe-4S binding protein [Fusobacterium sp. FSA-380-WT-3A]
MIEQSHGKELINFSSIGSIFSNIAGPELKNALSQGKNVVAISGMVVKPGVYEILETTTLSELIEMAGGITGHKKFKAAQFGLPFRNLVLEEYLDKPIDLGLFEDGSTRNIIILSEEDCMVSFSKFYLEYLLANKQRRGFLEYSKVEKEMERSWRTLDRISKGKGNTRDLFLLRQLCGTIKDTLGRKRNLVIESLEKFYHEFEEHVENKNCPAGQCIQLLQFKITDKCIGCTACARACPVGCISGSIKQKHTIDNDKCTHCGQCVIACPVGAIFEGDHTTQLLRDIATPNKIVVAQIAPAVRVAIGEAFGYEAGENVEKKLVAALKAIGIDYVFDTSWAADLTIMEEAKEFQERLEKYYEGDPNVKLPILTSCCPAWIKFFEQNYPDMLDVPSTVKSPMEIFSTVAKDIWAKNMGVTREHVSVVAIMPCLAKKYEASREEFSRGDNYDTDLVITTRELIKLFKQLNIDLKSLEDEEFDNPLGEYSGAGIIFGRTGGVIEAATRTTVESITGERLDDIEFHELRGWEGFRIAEIKVGHIELRIGISHGLEETGKMLDKIRAGEEFFHAIEIMACKGGCVGGGGQPKALKKLEVLKKRAEGLNNIDKSLPIRRSHENESVKKLYEDYLDYPLSRKAHELLHTRYFSKKFK